jgi:hypothetical protein
VPISRVLRSVPRSLCAVIDRALESNPRARYESLRDLARALKAIEREPVVQREIEHALARSVTVFGAEPPQEQGPDEKRHRPKARARPRALERSGRGRREMPPVGAPVAPSDRRPLRTAVGEHVGNELAEAMKEAVFGEFLFTLIYLGMFPVPPDSEPAGTPSPREDQTAAGEQSEPPPPETEVRPTLKPSAQPPSLAPSRPEGPSTLRSRHPQPPAAAQRSEGGGRENKPLRSRFKRLRLGLASVGLVVSVFLVLRAGPALRVEAQQALCVDLGGTANLPLGDFAPAPVAPPPLPLAAPVSSVSPPKPAPIRAQKKPTAPQGAESDPLRGKFYKLDPDGAEHRRSQ